MSFARKPAKPRAPLTQPELYDHAVRALGRRMRTQAELTRLLAARAEPGPAGAEAVNAVLARLRAHGYLNDTAYAETFARLRQENDKFGARRVRQDLRQKGIAAPLVEQTLAERYASTDEAALARQHLERKRIGKPTNPKDSARVMRRLLTAGFSTGTIYKVLRQWNVPDEDLAALDNLESEPPAE